MKLSLAYPALLLSALLFGTPLLDSGCKDPISPNVTNAVLTGEQMVCVLAADFAGNSDAETVLRFCGYVGVITKDVIDAFNSLVSARPSVRVDPVARAHYRAMWRAFQAHADGGSDAAPDAPRDGRE